MREPSEYTASKVGRRKSALPKVEYSMNLLFKIPNEYVVFLVCK